jgi:ribosomal protein RSM22 (predicted rRNA methylase)
MASPNDQGVVSIDGKKGGTTMGTSTERRRINKEEFRQQRRIEKPQRLVLEAIQEIKNLETVQLKRWQKPPKNG